LIDHLEEEEASVSRKGRGEQSRGEERTNGSMNEYI